MNQKTQSILISVVVTLLISIPLSVLLAYLFIDMKYRHLVEAPEQKSVQQTLQELSSEDASTATNTDSDVMEDEQPDDTVISRATEEELMPNQQTAATEIGRLSLERHVFTTNEATYEIEEQFSQVGQGGVTQIVYRAPHGKNEKTIWIENLRDLAPEALSPFQGFWIFANPKQGHLIYLRLIQFETEVPTGKIYAFNIQDKSLTLVEASVPNAGHFNAVVSPDGLRYVSFPESNNGHDQALYLVDLGQDMAEKILQLSANETLNAGGPALSVDADIVWFDNDTIRYAVYDQSQKNFTNTKEDIFLEYRTATVGQN